MLYKIHSVLVSVTDTCNYLTRVLRKRCDFYLPERNNKMSRNRVQCFWVNIWNFFFFKNKQNENHTRRRSARTKFIFLKLKNTMTFAVSTMDAAIPRETPLESRENRFLPATTARHNGSPANGPRDHITTYHCNG